LIGFYAGHWVSQWTQYFEPCFVGIFSRKVRHAFACFSEPRKRVNRGRRITRKFNTDPERPECVMASRDYLLRVPAGISIRRARLTTQYIIGRNVCRYFAVSSHARLLVKFARAYYSIRNNRKTVRENAESIFDFRPALALC